MSGTKSARERRWLLTQSRGAQIPVAMSLGWLNFVGGRLMFMGPTFCPHRVFMCFICLSEQTAIISLHRWLLLIGFCKWLFVFTNWTCNSGYFLSFKAVPWLRWLVAGLVQRRCGFGLRPDRVRFVVEKGTSTQVFSPSTSVFPCLYYYISAPYLSSCTCCCYKDKLESPGDV
jgi:hypothetical protein